MVARRLPTIGASLAALAALALLASACGSGAGQVELGGEHTDFGGIWRGGKGEGHPGARAPRGLGATRSTR